MTFFGQFHSFTLSRKVVWIDKYLPGGDLSSFYRAIKCLMPINPGRALATFQLGDKLLEKQKLPHSWVVQHS